MNQDFIKAGKIASQAREYGRSLIKENASVLEIAEKIEAKIRSLGGELSFPCDVSINFIAAHDSPKIKDERTLKKGDIVKIDLGAQVNGCVTDTACTVEVNSTKNKDLIKASEEALDNAIKLFTPGTKVCEIGKVIETTIKKYNLSPIRNLAGHGVGVYEIHTGINIPNYDNNNQTVLEKGMVFACEPFTTYGDGIVMDGKNSEVYSLEDPDKPIRDSGSREVLKYIKEKYKTLPFSKRDLSKKFNILKLTLALNNLEREGIIQQYNILVERSKGLVAQTEHTIIVDEKPVVVTK
ncbi:MAG: type II methionyl aminopeptidase [Candidatus Nanoarchaeia archaeon]